MQKLRFFLLFCLISPILGQRMTEDRVVFGGFMRQNLELVSAPLNVSTVPSNAHYHFRLGWIEPLYYAKSEIFKKTFIEPGVEAMASPYSSYLSAFFHLKIFSWMELKAGYRRQFYHATAVSYSSEPAKEEWKMENLWADISEVGTFAGGDIFHYGTFLAVPMLNFADLVLSYDIEFWNVDLEGKDFVYDFSSDFLLNPTDKVRTIGTDLFLFPRLPLQFALQNIFQWTKETQMEKDHLQLSLFGIPLNRENHFFFDLHLGLWILHPQLGNSPSPKNFTLSANFKWGLVLLGNN